MADMDILFFVSTLQVSVLKYLLISKVYEI